MPRFNGTGPRGMGPMTGRGMGYCIMPVVTRVVPFPYSLISSQQPYPCGRGRGLHPCGLYGRERGFLGRGLLNKVDKK